MQNRRERTPPPLFPRGKTEFVVRGQAKAKAYPARRPLDLASGAAREVESERRTEKERTGGLESRVPSRFPSNEKVGK